MRENAYIIMSIAELFQEFVQNCNNNPKKFSFVRENLKQIVHSNKVFTNCQCL